MAEKVGFPALRAHGKDAKRGSGGMEFGKRGGKKKQALPMNEKNRRE